MSKAIISCLLLITMLLCTLCACVAPTERGSGTGTEPPTNDTECTDTEPFSPETTDGETRSETALPELPSDPDALEMLYRKAHGLEDGAAFENYCRIGRVGTTPLPSLISVTHLSVGMTRGDVCAMIPGYAMICTLSTYRFYTTGGQPITAIFFVDCDRRYVVLELDMEERIEKITAYDEVVEAVPTAEDIRSIPEGATVYEVIDVLGFPRYASLAGNDFYYFTDNRLQGFDFTDVYDNNLRLHSSQMERITEDLMVWVEPHTWEHGDE